MVISPFTPIFFTERKYRSGITRPWRQVFSTEDEILVQIIRSSSEGAPDGKIVDAFTGKEVESVEWTSVGLGLSDMVDYCVLSSMEEGCYILRINGKESDPFMVSSVQSVLRNTVLIQYSLADNRIRTDAVPIVGERRLFFSFRVEGGFKDSGYSFSVDNEQFVTDRSDIVELYGRESTQRTLVVGNSTGVPIWVGQLLNRILTCRYVYIDGQRFARFESSVPQKEQIMEGVNSFVFTQSVQEIKFMKPLIQDALC